MFDRLQLGDTIGIFTPSSPDTVTARQRFERGKRFLEEKGFRICAHTHPMHAMPIGRRVRVVADHLKVTLIEEWM